MTTDEIMALADTYWNSAGPPMANHRNALQSAIEALQKDAARYRSVVAMVGILRNLGGMLPGTHQVVMSVVEAADDAMALDKP